LTQLPKHVVHWLSDIFVAGQAAMPSSDQVLSAQRMGQGATRGSGHSLVREPPGPVLVLWQGQQGFVRLYQACTPAPPDNSCSCCIHCRAWLMLCCHAGFGYSIVRLLEHRQALKVGELDRLAD
jgi:hypothetical protein